MQQRQKMSQLQPQAEASMEEPLKAQCTSRSAENLEQVTEIIEPATTVSRDSEKGQDES